MGILKTYLEEQLQLKYYGIKHLILLKVWNMADVSVGLLPEFIIFLIKKTSGATSGGGINDENMSDQQIPEELYKPIIGNLKNKKYTHFYRQYLGC